MGVASGLKIGGPVGNAALAVGGRTGMRVDVALGDSVAVDDGFGVAEPTASPYLRPHAATSNAPTKIVTKAPLNRGIAT